MSPTTPNPAAFSLSLLLSIHRRGGSGTGAEEERGGEGGQAQDARGGGSAGQKRAAFVRGIVRRGHAGPGARGDRHIPQRGGGPGDHQHRAQVLLGVRIRVVLQLRAVRNEVLQPQVQRRAR
jgi:hypothetical protein